MKKIIKFIFSYQWSKILILLETILVFYATVKSFTLATLAINGGFEGSLPWITSLVGLIYAAYGTSVGFYYNKGKAEEVAKIQNGIGQAIEDNENKPTI